MNRNWDSTRFLCGLTHVYFMPVHPVSPKGPNDGGDVPQVGNSVSQFGDSVTKLKPNLLLDLSKKRENGEISMEKHQRVWQQDSTAAAANENNAVR